MTILIIGLGSIGQRHLRNIRQLFGNSIRILAFRERKLDQAFTDTMNVDPDSTVEQKYNVTSYYTIQEALAQKPDMAFITTITSKHITYALSCAQANCDIFIEKPISNSLENISELEKLIAEKNIFVFTGFQNRYHPCIVKTKSFLEQHMIGDVINVHAEIGERLSTMHTYENYKTTYMATKNMGGGLILNQAIHELDYLYYLFGEYVPDSILTTTNDTLGIDVEDNFIALFHSRNDNFSISLTGDFFQYPPVRNCKIVGTKGRIEFDLLKAEIITVFNDEKNIISFPAFKRNDMFLQEDKDFIEAHNNKLPPKINLADGINSLKTALTMMKMLRRD